MTASPRPKTETSSINQYGLSPINSATSQPRLHIISSQGQLQVYSAPYRGSFSTVLSEALRSAGLGSRVLIAQFLKGGVSQGPKNSIRLCGKLEWLRPDINGCINKNQINKDLQEKSLKNAHAVKEVWEICKQQLIANQLDKVVLDEIGLAIELGFISEKDLIDTLENRNNSIDVILTGPSIPSKVFFIADQVTQLRSSK